MNGDLNLPAGYGQVAYEGYRAHTAVSLITGDQLPPWHELPGDIRDAWDAAAAELIGYLDRIPR